MPIDLPPASVPERLPLPHTVGMSGPDIELIECGIAAYNRHDIQRAHDDFARALAIRAQTAVAHFNYGVTDVLLGRRTDGAAAMQRGFRLAGQHGMAASPQAAMMRRIAASLDVLLE